MLAETLSAKNPRSLTDSRLQLHHAAQVAARPGRFLAPPAADDRHTAFRWDGAGRRMSGEIIGDGRAWRAALALEPLALQLLDGGAVGAQFPLAGQTLAGALRWLRREAAGRGADEAALAGTIPYEIPAHPVGGGAPLSVLEPDAALLSAWYGFAVDALEAWRLAQPGADPLLIWPHHFDLGTLVWLDAGKTSSLGAGFSPGDGAVPEPYFYLNRWPAAKTAPPELPIGRWNPEGWFGAVLTATELLASGDPAVRVTQFLTAGTALLRRAS